MQVLRLRAAGREKEADALEKEFQARAEAIRIAKDTGRSEEDALKVVRERQRLEEQIERNKKNGIDAAGGARSAIRRSTSGINAAGGRRIDAGGGRIGIERRIGLRAAATDRARDSRPRDPEAENRRAALNFYQKNLQQNEELLNIWRTIGVA
jgi:hypothetical protein